MTLPCAQRPCPWSRLCGRDLAGHTGLDYWFTLQQVDNCVEELTCQHKLFNTLCQMTPCGPLRSWATKRCSPHSDLFRWPMTCVLPSDVATEGPRALKGHALDHTVAIVWSRPQGHVCTKVMRPCGQLRSWATTRCSPVWPARSHDLSATQAVGHQEMFVPHRSTFAPFRADCPPLYPSEPPYGPTVIPAGPVDYSRLGYWGKCSARSVE